MSPEHQAALVALVREWYGLVKRMPNAVPILTPGTTGAQLAARTEGLLRAIGEDGDT